MRLVNLRSGNWTTAAMLACGMQCLAGVVAAEDIVLGPGDIMAMDQPRITVALEDPANLGVSMGPDAEFVMDTGANGVMLGMGSYDADHTFQSQTRTDGTTVHYTETGVAGGEPYELLKVYNLDFAGTDGTVHEVTNLRAMGSSTVDLDFAGVAGMPVMNNRVSHWDLTPNAGSNGLIDVSFPQTVPASTTGRRYTIPLAQMPAVYSTPERAGDPTPTYAPLPLIQNAKFTFGAKSTQQTMLLDTGAQVSMISTPIANLLGYNLNDPDTDPTSDVEGYLPVMGVGGTVNMPIIKLSRIGIPTNGGHTLVLTDLEVGVLDIAGISGVIGMNVLTSGYFNASDPVTDYGYFANVTMDFTEGQWVMHLDANPAFVPEPTSLVLLTLGAGLLMRRRSKSVAVAA
jgi:hypothetical protein